ncbi:Putative SWI/SNF-related matrix-associated actin-dependent regulator of chromatin subfamily A member 3-like 2 [Triticum urartu]|uniref:Putative SWI/SNF-related matrix-associated actin-dependent regulator of chromatin subfamily A member 3-like 2 n=1 Tax=Triticum urartu TaxID=4572 RepID=M7Z118_TRIUA|nr:Putative SWI/SNF-related matrix-associated actin-dependent regulator of chromatin subfamily A member 3-like 2 [Triticum urartu]
MAHLGMQEHAAQEPGDQPRATPARNRSSAQPMEARPRPEDADLRSSTQSGAVGAPRGAKRKSGKQVVEEGARVVVVDEGVGRSRGHGISFTRLDGTLNLQQREKVIREFSEDKRILVLLMSLKAGGVGINLTAASNAFVMDPWWNPAVEEQAVMRIHRIGQMKSVSIKRFIVKGTVEERMEAVQARKQRMISGALTDQEFRTARLEELKMLFS